MKRLVTLALVLAVLSLAAPSRASTTRLLSLGLDNWQLTDETNLWSNPARLLQVPNLALFEVGTQNGGANQVLDSGSQWGGFHKSIGTSAFAVYIRRPYGTNDFTASATPVVTPVPGGLITSAMVVGNASLPDATANTASVFGNYGPFGTNAANNSALSISNAPIMARTLAVPANLFDVFYAWTWGPSDLGIQVNYARNKGGETRRSYFDPGAGAGTPGKILLERMSQEVNLRAGWLWRTSDSSGFQLVSDFSIPFYKMHYEELRPNGAYSRSDIDNAAMVNAGVMMQWAGRLEGDQTYNLTARAAQLDVTGIASRRDDSTPGGALEFDRDAYFANIRRYAGMDFTWGCSLHDNQALLLASLGILRTSAKQTWVFSDRLAPANARSEAVFVDQWLVPARIALEARPWRLMALRAGIQKNFFAESRTRTDAGTAVTETDTAISDPNGTANGVGLSFGVGFQLVEGMMWDTVVRQTLLFHGPYFVGGVTGSTTEGGLFAQSTLSYRFGDAPAGPRYSAGLKPLIPLKKLLSRLHD